MFNLKIPKHLLEFIDNSRGIECRAVYILKCIAYIKNNNIDVITQYENTNNDGTSKNEQKGKDSYKRTM